MNTAISDLEETGLFVSDLQSDPEFAGRRLHIRGAKMQIEGMSRLASALVENPGGILQELVNAAIDLCGSDSAGITIEQQESADDEYYRWVATAGRYSQFLNAKLPRYPSACGVTLERRRPQIFRVTQRFFDLMGIQAPTVTDGILLPWEVEGTRGTIWIMAHGRTAAFDREDCRLMQVLASFAAMGIRQQRQDILLSEQVSHSAAAAIANDLATELDNILQSLSHALCFSDRGGVKAQECANPAAADLQRLSELVRLLLTLSGGLPKKDTTP
jgi:hypothetical protein